MNLPSAFSRAPRPAPKKTRIVGRHALRERLIMMIAKGKIRPGEKLVQFRLARRFGVSISLIREALLDLQAYGLIETDDNRGFFVRAFDAKALLDFYDVREVLEGMAARTACSHFLPVHFTELSRIVEDICSAEEAGNHERRAGLDRLFHNRINEISTNRTITSLTRQCSLFGKILWMPHDVADLRAIHMKIIETIRDNRPDEAEELARHHVRDGRRQAAKVLEGGQEMNWLLPSA